MPWYFIIMSEQHVKHGFELYLLIEKLIQYGKMGQIKSGRSYIKLDGLQPKNGGNFSLKKPSKTVFPETLIDT